MHKYYVSVNGSIVGEFSYNDLLNWIGDRLYKKVAYYPNGQPKQRWRSYDHDHPVEYKYELRIRSYEDGSDRYRDKIVFLDFWNSFAHNPQDGTWSLRHWKEDYSYERIFDEEKLDWKFVRVVKSREWIAPIFTPKKYQVTDSYGRIINSKDLKIDFLKHKYNPDWKNISNTYKSIPKRKAYKYYRMYKNRYVFRSGPVPYIHKWKSGHWHEYRGKHGHTIQELRQYFRDIIEQRIIKEEYGITFKIHRNNSELNPYNLGHHVGTKGRGWKRSRKRKQWM